MSTNILIVCNHNSARSVLGEGMLNHWAQRMRVNVRAYSAGSAPSARINPFALEALANAGVDVSPLRSKSWDRFKVPGAPSIQVVITVCESAAKESCPLLTNRADDPPVRVHWGYPDPSEVPGGIAAKRAAFELTRQALSYRVLQLLALPLETLSRTALQGALSDIAKR